MSVTKGFIKNNNTKELRNFLYNPTSISESRSIRFQEITSAGKAYPIFQYLGGDSSSINIELFLHSTQGDVKGFLAFVKTFEPDETQRFKAPPSMLLTMGAWIKTCVVTQLDIQHEEWTEALDLKQATVKLTLKEVR